MANTKRNPSKEQFWRDVLARYASSGLNVREFCHREQLKENSFYAWRRTITDRDQAGSSPPAFVSATINGEAKGGEPLVLGLAGGLQLRLPQTTSADRVAELVRALKSQSASWLLMISRTYTGDCLRLKLPAVSNAARTLMIASSSVRDGRKTLALRFTESQVARLGGLASPCESVIPIASIPCSVRYRKHHYND